MQEEIDILENDIKEQYPEVLNILLRDRTTQKNIFWASNNYQHLGENYQFSSQIFPELITGENGNVIMPRVKKDKELQQSRVKSMAEVFTPSWVCNAQNNLIDNSWFGREDIFNKEIQRSDGSKTWEVITEKVVFPDHLTWKDYINDTRLEITCGEAPYITSRYDTTTGEFISIERRIGILDRKLRVISENVDDSEQWLKVALIAYKNTYAYEWQGDSLLIARESMLITFIENYTSKFYKEPSLEYIISIAYIISWNVWQMDGLKCVVPNSCSPEKIEQLTIGKEPEIKFRECIGCSKNIIEKHNGVYCIIKDWFNKDLTTGKYGRDFKFIDLLKDN